MNKRLVILAHGSRGDIQPYVALGRALQDAGYQVRLACPARFEEFVGQNGLEFASLAGDPAEMARMLADQARSNYLKTIVAMLNYAMPLAVEIATDTMRVCQDADAIIHSFMMTLSGHEAARQLAIPDLSALIFGVFSPTSTFPNPLFPALPLGGRYNRLTHQLFDRTFWWGSKLGYGWLRRKNRQLPRLHGWPYNQRGNSGEASLMPVLYGLSPQLLPEAEEWAGHIHMTGYWFLDSPSWRPPAELVAFLEAGSPPVFIGFGSNITSQARSLTRIAVEALAISHQRGLLLTGWGSLDQLALPSEMVAGKQLLAIDSAPFDWLFPHMAALVHHGGMGTTADGLRAGIPAVVAPLTADQPFWGRQLHQLGLSPPPIRRKMLTAHRLAEAILDVTGNAQRRTRISQVSQAIQEEDGLGKAVSLINRYLG